MSLVMIFCGFAKIQQRRARAPFSYALKKAVMHSTQRERARPSYTIAGKTFAIIVFMAKRKAVDCQSAQTGKKLFVTIASW